MGQYVCRIGCAQILGARDAQEDYFALDLDDRPDFIVHGGRLFVVSDGMGGHESGEVASVLAVRRFRQAYHAKRPGESVPEALRRAARAANDAVYEEGRNRGGARPMGATLAAVALLEDELFWIAVGDSLIFLARERRLMRMNATHTYGDVVREEAGDDATNTERNDALVSYLGMETLRRMDAPTQPIRLYSGDRVLLASDGLTQFLDEERVRDLIARGGDIQEVCDRLVAAANQPAHPQQDNVTVVAVELVEDAGSVSAARPAKRGRRGALAACLIMLLLTAVGAGGYLWMAKYTKASEVSAPEAISPEQCNSVTGEGAELGTLNDHDTLDRHETREPTENGSSELADGTVVDGGEAERESSVEDIVDEEALSPDEDGKDEEQDTPNTAREAASKPASGLDDAPDWDRINETLSENGLIGNSMPTGVPGSNVDEYPPAAPEEE